MNKVNIFSIRFLGLMLFLGCSTFCGKKSSGVGLPPRNTDTTVVVPPVDTAGNTIRYAVMFYFSVYGETLFSDAATAPNGDVWVMNGQTPAYSPYGIVNFWGKPAWAASHGDGSIKKNYRFYYDGDPIKTNDSLLDYHADLLTAAGIDLVVLDFTNGAADFDNGPSYISATKALCNRWQKRMEAGKPIPKIAFFVMNETALTIVENTFFNVYKPGLFFNYLDKKLLLVAKPNDALGQGDLKQPAVPVNGKFANYTARHCWGLDNSSACWQFKVNSADPPKAFYYNGKPEQMCAPVATQASYMTMDGTTVMDGAQGRDGGGYFKKYMAAATLARPKFVFIHSWNEWGAGNWGTQENPNFVDQWGTEYSSDIEPMAGGHGDKYYQLLKEEVAKFKK